MTFTMREYELKAEIWHALRNTIGFYNRGDYKLAIKYYGQAYLLYEYFEDTYGTPPKDIAEAFCTMSELIDTLDAIKKEETK